MKKLTDLLFSTVIAVAMVSSAASAYSAENFEYDSVTLGESYSVQNDDVAMYSMLPVGAYYCQSSRFAYIQINSTTSATTTCTVYNIYCPELGKYICGTGGYVYNLNHDFYFSISSWYEYGTHNVSKDELYISAEYSGGNIILGNETYAMD